MCVQLERSVSFGLGPYVHSLRSNAFCRQGLISSTCGYRAMLATCCCQPWSCRSFVSTSFRHAYPVVVSHGQLRVSAGTDGGVHE